MPVSLSSAPSSPPPPKPPQLPSKKSLFYLFLGLFLFLFLLFFVFLVLMLVQNGGNNPVLNALGVEPALLKQFLQALISIVFGILSLISLIVALVGVFRRATSAKIEDEKKKRSVKMAIIAGLGLFVFVTVWVVLYAALERIQIGSQGSATILTDPADTLGLTAPVNIIFDAREIEKLYEREGIVSFSWDLDGDKKFDDGNGRAIQYTYETKGNADGQYNAGVKVVLGTGKEMVVNKLVTISNVLPTVVVDYEPKTLEVPGKFTFDASSSKDPNGSIIEVAWDFDGDQTFEAKGEKTEREFLEPGDVNVTVQVMDNNGATAQKTVSLSFVQGREKKAFIIVRPGTNGSLPFKISADGSKSFLGEKIQIYEWDFGDGTPGVQGRVAEHIYQELGKFSLKLMIQGESGKKSEASETILVENPKQIPVSRIEVLNQVVIGNGVKGKIPLKLDLDAGKSTDADGKIIEYRWDFMSDGTVDAVLAKTSFTFVESGTFILTLIVLDDEENQGKSTLTIEALPPGLQTDLKASPTSGVVPLEVTFDASGSRADEGTIVSYTWNFGDGSPEIAGSAKQTYRFENVGEFRPKVTLLTDKGKKALQDILIVVRDVEIQADFSYLPTEPAVGEKIFFDASKSSGQISKYFWEFGEGSISRVVKPEFSYQNPGTYTVTLEVYDRKNRMSRKFLEITISP